MGLEMTKMKEENVLHKSGEEEKQCRHQEVQKDEEDRSDVKHPRQKRGPEKEQKHSNWGGGTNIENGFTNRLITKGQAEKGG